MEIHSFAVVALVDALGFSGIERRMDPQQAAVAMRVARASMAQMTDWLNGDGGYHHFHTIGGKPTLKRSWFSDTMCLVVQPPAELVREVVQLGRDGDIPAKPRFERHLDPYRQAALVDVAVVCIGYFLRAAADSALPFAFRGVVTVGDAIIDDENIYMGSAICEAAKLYEKAQGAFVWLTPEACKLPLSGVSRNHHGLVRYNVPMKDGPSISTKVVSPFIDTLPNSPPGRQLRDGIINAMEGDRADIVIKRNNTIAFLDYVAATDSGPSVYNAVEG
jgi:hypothetical protein